MSEVSGRESRRLDSFDSSLSLISVVVALASVSVVMAAASFPDSSPFVSFLSSSAADSR